MENPGFTTVCEITGSRITSEQLQRMYTRYRFASEFCRDKKVLEVACGSGQGLGYLAQYAREVTGGDCDDNILRYVYDHYHDRVEIRNLDAENLPFEDGSYDVVIFYEAIYYLERPDKFINEAKRILRENGTLLICSANKEWPGFNPSPFSHAYLSANELFSMLDAAGLKTDLFADCPTGNTTFKGRLTGLIKIIAVKLHLIPGTMKGKELLKRIFHGKLVTLPAELRDGIADYTPPIPIRHDLSVTGYKVIFAAAKK